MGDLSEFSTGVRLFLKAYPWRRIDPVPEAPLRRPLEDCRLALVTTAGLVLPEQEPFDASIRGGDYSFREIPVDVDVGSLIDTQRSESYDHSGLVKDPNVAFPLERARESVEQGRIGSLNARHLSFMGSITAPGRLIKRSAPEATALLVSDEVDIPLLCPVSPMCNQTVGLVAAELERQGISTVAIQMLRMIAETVRPPRSLVVPFRHGYPFGAPFDSSGQAAVLEAALRLLEYRTGVPLLEDFDSSS